MAAAEDSPLVGLTAAPAVAERGTEALAWNEIRRVHHRSEELVAYKVLEEPNEGGILVAGAEAAAEVGFGDEAAPALADERDAGKRGRLRREAEEDLGEDVVVVRQSHRRGRAGAGAVAAPRHLIAALGPSRGEISIFDTLLFSLTS